MKLIPTTPADLEKLKARAKILKRKHGIPHREALNRAAREAKYLHWHHAVLCQEQSQADAIAASMQFFCESIAKDAIKGETHYVSYGSPPMVFVADGRKNAFVLDAKSSQAVVLAVDGNPLDFEADDDSLTWGAAYRSDGDAIELKLPDGTSLRLAVDAAKLEEALAEANEEPAGDIYQHDLDSPEGQQFFDQVFGGAGLEPVTPEAVKLLLASGYEQKAIDDAVATGAMFSRPRCSLLYPPVMGE